jgi:hypothetical protein
MALVGDGGGLPRVGCEVWAPRQHGSLRKERVEDEEREKERNKETSWWGK